MGSKRGQAATNNDMKNVQFAGVHNTNVRPQVVESADDSNGNIRLFIPHAEWTKVLTFS